MNQQINCKGKLENWVCVFDNANPKSMKAVGVLVDPDEPESKATPVVTSDVLYISNGILKTLDACFSLGTPRYSMFGQMIDFQNDFGPFKPLHSH